MKKILASTLILTLIAATSYGYCVSFSVKADKSTNFDSSMATCFGRVYFSNSETFYLNEFASGTATLTKTGNGLGSSIGKAYINGELVCNLTSSNTSQFNYPSGNNVTLYAYGDAYANTYTTAYALTTMTW